MIDIVSATRSSKSDFWTRSPLGQSLNRLSFDKRIVPRVAYENTRGLPDIYNVEISDSRGSEIVVFVHDDVWLDDYHLGDRVIAGLDAFDIVGIAGNRRRLPRQPGWSIINTQLAWEDRANVSGVVAHGPGPFGAISHFGDVPAECEILDGVFLAARRNTLIQNAILFDARFAFHFYDLDFCRTARQSGLRLGTWPICVTHQSKGGFGSDMWHEGYRSYIAKWGD